MSFLSRLFGRDKLETMPVAVRASVGIPYPVAAESSRRTDGWPRYPGGPNREVGANAPRLRRLSRGLVRDNAMAHAIVREWTTLVVGDGFVANSTPEAEAIWSAWSKQCDAQGAGRSWNTLLRTAVRARAEGGEVYIRRRPRRPGDTVNGLPGSEPLDTLVQVQLLEAEQLAWDAPGTMYGIELDALDRPRAFRFYRRHPDETVMGFVPSSETTAVVASDIAHYFDATARPGVMHGLPLLTPVMQDIWDLGGVRDAKRVKERVAAALSVLLEGSPEQLMSDSGVPRPIGTDRTDALATDADGLRVDGIEPGAILRLPTGMKATVVQPPQSSGFDERWDAHNIASGAGLTYSRMTGDLSQVNYSSGKLGEANSRARVETERDALKSMVLDRVWRWVMQAAVLDGRIDAVPEVEWIDTPLHTLDPQKEAAAYLAMMEMGAMTWSDVVRRVSAREPSKHVATLIAERDMLAESGFRHPFTAAPAPVVDQPKGEAEGPGDDPPDE